MIVNVATKLNRIQHLIDWISDNEEIHDIVQAIYIQDIFLFSFDVCEKTEVDGD